MHLAALWQTAKTHDRARHLTLGAIILVALVLRLVRLSFQPLWWDEGWSLYFATTDLGSLLHLTAVDIHPPFYYLLLKAWIAVVGASPVAVRLLSIFIGTATVPLLYAVARRMLGEKAALLASLLLALNPLAIYYSQEVRMYSLVTLLGLAAFHFALQLAESPTDEGQTQPLGRSRGWSFGSWAGYVVAAGFAVHTQYYAAFLVLALNVVVLARWIRQRRRLREWLAWLSAQAALVLVCVPWFAYAGSKLLSYVRYKVAVENDVPQGIMSFIGRHLAAFNWGHAEGGLAVWWWVGLVPLAGLALCVLTVLAWRRERKAPATTGFRPDAWGLLSCAVICAVLLLCGFGVNLIFPFNAPRIERQLLLALPYYLLVVTGALAFLWRRRHALRPTVGQTLALLPLAGFLAAGFVSLSFLYAVPRYPDDDYRPVADRIRALGQPTDVIVNVHPWQVGYFRSYLPDSVRPYLILSPREVLPSERQLWNDEPARLAADLDGLLAQHGRVWLPAHQAMGRVLEDRIDAYLVAHGHLALSEWYGQNTVLSLFGGGNPIAQPVTVRFGGWLALQSAAVGSDPFEAGYGLVPVDLTWRLSASPKEAYIVGLRLTDAAGRVWSQRDAEPVGGREPFSLWPVGQARSDKYGLRVLAGTPPGEYRVTLRVYRADDQSVLPATFEGGSGGEVHLGSIQVVRPKTPPPLEALDIRVPLRMDWGVLRLHGFDANSDAPLLPGDLLEVSLYWQALRDPGEDLNPRLQLLDAQGAVLAELTEKPVAGSYPTAWWKAGELVRDPHALAIPAAVQPDRYRVGLSVVRSADGTSLKSRRGQTSIDFLEITVEGRDHRYAPTGPQHPQQALLGPSVELLGYDLPDAIQTPGSALTITLEWHALATPDRSYHVFVHMLNSEGRTVAQHDGQPGGGKLPTLGWLPGEYLTDTHVLQLPYDLSRGEYSLEVGMYDPTSGQRLGEAVTLQSAIAVSAP